jgi:hypothetical protein
MPKPLTETVAAEVRAELARHNITRTEAAAALGMSRTLLWSRLRGETSFKVAERRPGLELPSRRCPGTCLMSRNFAAEMRSLIDAETSTGPYVSAVVAEHIVEKLLATDTDLLDGWLRAQAVNFLRHAINLRDCSQRTHARMTASRSVFRNAAEAADAGDTEALGSFLHTVYVIEDGSRVRLSEMRKPELLFVADDYGRRASDALLQEAFLRALAKKVGTKRVSDVYDEDKLAKLWQSISAR